MKQDQSTLPVEGLVGTKAATNYLKLSKSTWTKLLAAEKVKPPIKFGRANRWDVEYIRELGRSGIS